MYTQIQVIIPLLCAKGQTSGVDYSHCDYGKVRTYTLTVKRTHL